MIFGPHWLLVNGVMHQFQKPTCWHWQSVIGSWPKFLHKSNFFAASVMKLSDSYDQCRMRTFDSEPNWKCCGYRSTN